jgi:hypothetical protein
MSQLVVATTKRLSRLTSARGPNALDSLAAPITLGDVELLHSSARKGRIQSDNKRYQRSGVSFHLHLIVQEAGAE